MKFSAKTLAATAALGLCMAATAVAAQKMGGTNPASSSSSMGHRNTGTMHHDRMHRDKISSMHKMPASVTSVDAKTGLVGVEAGGKALTVHFFPPKSMADLKVGDKITLHMGFSSLEWAEPSSRVERAGSPR